METNWEMEDDEEAFEGPDAYVEGDEIDYDAAEELILEGQDIQVQESSAQGILRCACAS